jgi:hypothetical protein
MPGNVRKIRTPRARKPEKRADKNCFFLLWCSVTRRRGGNAPAAKANSPAETIIILVPARLGCDTKARNRSAVRSFYFAPSCHVTRDFTVAVSPTNLVTTAQNNQRITRSTSSIRPMNNRSKRLTSHLFRIRALKTFSAFFLVVCLMGQLAFAADQNVVVYSDVPGLAASEHFQARIKPASATGDSAWKSAFMWKTACNYRKEKPDRYFQHLEGWTHSYVNFEMSVAVEVELTRVGSQPIRTAVARPAKHVASCIVRDGKVYIVLKQPCLVMIDIDGQMDEQNTGMGYNGPPIHTVSLFANPLVHNKPQPNGPGVRQVKPGEMPPTDGDWKTLYFLPGVHDVGVAFRVRANRSYYIPGDAMVYGTLQNHQAWDNGHHIRIFGVGTLSGARLTHPDLSTDERVKKRPSLHNPIEIVGQRTPPSKASRLPIRRTIA